MYRKSLDGYFWIVQVIVCSMQNESETADKWSGVFTCTLSELYICNQEEKLMQVA